MNNAHLNPVLHALLERHSTGPRYLIEPGPSDAELLMLTEAALRAPDHAALVPFRFRAVRGAARARMRHCSNGRRWRPARMPNALPSTTSAR